MTIRCEWRILTTIVAVLIGWSISAVRAEQPATAPATAPEMGTITGVIMYDGQPVNAVMVRLIKPQRDAQARRQAAKAQAANPAKPAKEDKAARAAKAAAKQQPVATVTTDDNGRFTFKDVPPGDYAIAVAIRKQANGRARVHLVAGQAANVSIQMREIRAGAKNKALL